MTLVITLVCVVGALVLISLIAVPLLLDIFLRIRMRRNNAINKQLDTLFDTQKTQKILKLIYIVPGLLGVIGFLLFQQPFAIIGGVIIGLFIPTALVKLAEKKRHMQFNTQILDAIMILSSSLKGGLSLLQALEVLQEELPAPMSQEIGLVVRENKMGVSLEESLKHLDKRMKLDDLTMVINSIQVARETGGDLTKVFSRVSTTIRDNRKLKDSIRTLTLQGRMQGFIMSVLPILFVMFVHSTNKDHFVIMFASETGRMLLIAAAVLWVVGVYLMYKFSIIKV